MSIDPSRPTLAIYGIPDRNDQQFPEESHDHGLVLMNQGKIEWAIQLERLTGVKHDHRLPAYLFDLLKEKQLLPGDFDLVFSNNVLGSAIITTNGKIRMESGWQDHLVSDLIPARAWWIDRPKQAWLVNHELAHVFSALPFYPDIPEETLLVHFDGGASVSNFSAFKMSGSRLSVLEAHWRLKYLSGFFNANALVFGIIGARKEEQLSVPGKMMGLAGFGQYREELEFWLREHQWFADIWGRKQDFIDRAAADFGWTGKQLSTQDPFCQDLVATLHEVFVRETMKEFQRLREESGLRNLVFSGGSALNIVLNARLTRSGLFDRVMIPPCCNDSGLALGSAVFTEWKKGHAIGAVAPYLMTCSDYPDFMEEEADKQLTALAKRLGDGEIVAFFHGPGEIGPRALGNRSILCRADRVELAQKLSMQVKGREWYRPVAPVMLESQLGYFTGQKDATELSRFMLDEFVVLPERRGEIAGAVHKDGTARIQVIRSEEDHPTLWKLLHLLLTDYGIRALINTSFNQRGKPIVHTREQAREQAKEMDIPVFFA